MYKATIAALFFVCTEFLFACSGATNSIQQNATPVPEPAAAGSIACQPDGVCTKTDGWRLPSLEAAKASAASKETLKDSSGKNIEVAAVNYVLENTFAEEPFNLIGKNFGKLKLSFVRQFSKNEKVFAYVIFAQRADEASKGLGMSFFYSFRDYDGDGKFETLVGGQKPELTVPDWTLRNAG